MPYNPETAKTQALIYRQMEFDAMRTLAEFSGRQHESKEIRDACLRAEAILAHVNRVLDKDTTISRHDPLRLHLMADKWNPDRAFDENGNRRKTA